MTLSNKMRTIHDEINTKSEYSHDKLVEITRKHYEKQTGSGCEVFWEMLLWKKKIKRKDR